jgi:hypothetical protein
MTAWSSSLVVLLALAAQGCVTGHLFDAARRIERPLAYEEAALDGDRVLLRYTALVMNDDGDPVGRRERRVAVALADLRRAGVPVDAFAVEHLPDGGPLGGTAVPLHPNGSAPWADVERTNGRDVRLRLHESRDGGPKVLESAALTRRRTEPWVYPLVPVALAIDLVTNPVLLFFAPAVIVVGD